MTFQDSVAKLERSRRRLNQIEIALKQPNLDPPKRKRLRSAQKMQKIALRLRQKVVVQGPRRKSLKER